MATQAAERYASVAAMGVAHPQVSILIPAYNTSHYIATTLDSVFAQTFRSFEAIVINDGSPDTSELERVLEPYMDRIVYLKQKNAGLAAARNRGVRHARGKYLALLDSDDAWFPTFLEAQMLLFNQAPPPDLVCADLMKVQDLLPRRAYWPQIRRFQQSATFEAILTQQCQVIASSVVVRRQSVVEAGFFDERFRRAEDYGLWLRIAHRGGKIHYQHRTLGQRLIRCGSLSADSEMQFAAGRDVLVTLDEELQLTPERRGLLRGRTAHFGVAYEVERARRLLLAGQVRLASELLRSARDHSHSPRARLMLAGLETAPGITRAALRVWLRVRARAKSLALRALAYAFSR